MKRTLVVLMALMFVATVASAQYSNPALIKNTYHDLSASSTTSGDKATSFNQICYFCHTPHQMVNNQDTHVTITKLAAPILPLWNKYLSTFQYGPVYNSISMPVTPTSLTLSAPDGSVAVQESNLCLSCHDGSVGINTLYKGAFSSTDHKNHSPGMDGEADDTQKLMGQNFPQYVLGNDATIGFRQEHPINFSYTAAAAVNTVGLATPKVAANGRKYFTSSDGRWVPLYDGDTMQCGSCHDVHNFAGPSHTTAPFLRATTTGSALCLTCHTGTGQ